MAADDDLKRWVQTWKEAAPELEAIRRREVAELDTHAVIASLEGAINYAIRTAPPRLTSGMVEMQRYSLKVLLAGKK
ncbi:MAG TPA: hypothetical protein VGL53_06440 [Bryobacteraceae bacterium]|jgi:hypothetical protein